MPRPRAPGSNSRLAYHASRTPLALGTILTARGENLLDGDIEDTIEAARPKSTLGRREAIYAAPNRAVLEHLTAGHDYLYRIEITDFILLDHAWANRIWSIFAESHDPPDAAATGRIANLARHYWSGRRAPETPLIPYAPEYLCRTGRIVESLDD